ncbi:MAG: hypothetical protein U1E73_13270 [Planctomycetota bacterium]
MNDDSWLDAPAGSGSEEPSARDSNLKLFRYFERHADRILQQRYGSAAAAAAALARLFADLPAARPPIEPDPASPAGKVHLFSGPRTLNGKAGLGRSRKRVGWRGDGGHGE